MKNQDPKMNESGMVLLSVLIISLVLAVAVVSVLMLNASRVKLGEKQIRNIQAEQLAVGQYWNNYSSLTIQGSPVTYSSYCPYNNSTICYSTSLTKTTGGGPENTDKYSILVNTPSAFQ